MADRCLACHADVADEMRDAATLHGALLAGKPTVVCRPCHTEHRGADAPDEPRRRYLPPPGHRLLIAGPRRVGPGSALGCADCHGLSGTSATCNKEQPACCTSWRTSWCPTICPRSRAINETIDGIEDQVFHHPPLDPEQIFTLKRTLLHLRRIIAPQREVLNKLARGDFAVVAPDDRMYFRDVYDHLVRMYDITESLRDLVGGVLETYLSVVNNRMNEVMKTLTLITTLFMPLSFLAGFFGMNFFAPVTALDAWTDKPAFVIALVVMVVTPGIMYVWMRRRAWMVASAGFAVVAALGLRLQPQRRPADQVAELAPQDHEGRHPADGVAAARRPTITANPTKSTMMM